MQLICDDKEQVYVWVDEEGHELSPHFDYEEDAIKWREQPIKELNDEWR